MSSVKLLDDTRKINQILHRKNSGKVAFNDICEVMRSVLDSNVLVISKKGKILGTGYSSEFDPMRGKGKVSQIINRDLNERATFGCFYLFHFVFPFY